MLLLLLLLILIPRLLLFLLLIEPLLTQLLQRSLDLIFCISSIPHDFRRFFHGHLLETLDHRRRGAGRS